MLKTIEPIVGIAAVVGVQLAVGGRDHILFPEPLEFASYPYWLVLVEVLHQFWSITRPKRIERGVFTGLSP